MNPHRGGNDTGRCKDFGVGEEVRHLENHPGDIRTFPFGLLVAAFTVTADFTLTGYPAAARTLPATSSSLGAAGHCFVSGSYPSPRKTLRL